MNKKVIVKTGIEYYPDVVVEDTADDVTESAVMSISASENSAEWSVSKTVADQGAVGMTAKELEAQLYGFFSKTIQSYLKNALSAHREFSSMTDDAFAASSIDGGRIFTGVSKRECDFFSDIANDAIGLIREYAGKNGLDADEAANRLCRMTTMDSMRMFVGGVNILNRNASGEYEFSSEEQYGGIKHGIAVKYANDMLFGNFSAKAAE